MIDRWSLLLEAARTTSDRVGPPGSGLVKRDGTWHRECDDPDGLIDPLLPVLSDGMKVVAHLAQSLDGRIALPDGRSRWISGEADLVHTHRLRALCDAVVVGAYTVEADDPQLTVRHCAGPSPVRVVIDPRGRLRSDRKVFAEPEPETWRITAEPTGAPHDLVVPANRGVIDPHDVLRVLADRGLNRILVEGGGITVSRFLAAGVIDRLHLVIASVIVGAGRPSLTLQDSHARSLAACLRPPIKAYPLGGDVLLDCAIRERAPDHVALE
ncbi:MAG: RibD family protein [Myxococcota bacterium]